jgi:DNA repair exonuclease SbcCD ATPase subunit
MTIQQVREEMERRKGQRQQLQKQISETQELISRLAREGEEIRVAQAIIQSVATATQQQLEYHVSELVSLALSAVFPDPYRLHRVFEPKRGKSEAVLSFSKEDGERIDPLTASGGGPVDVAAFALRVSLWSLRKPRTRATLIVDEPFRYVSQDLQPRASAMLKEISQRLSIQFIIVTHEVELLECADKVFRVAQKDRVSHVEVG